MSGVFYFEIPVIDLTRAMRFYSTVLGVDLKAQPGMGTQLAMLPDMDGALVQGEDYFPSPKGVVIYLDASPNLNGILNRVPGAGGKVLLPKENIGEHGFAAYFEDTEGNKIGLHSFA